MENFIFCTVQRKFMNLFVAVMVDQIFCVNGVKIAEKIIFKNLFFWIKSCNESLIWFIRYELIFKSC